MITKIDYIAIDAERQKTPEGLLCANSVLSGVAHLYIPTDASIPCPRTKKDDVVLGYERGYALYKSPNGRKKVNGSVGMFRPTVGFCAQGDLGTMR